MPSPFVQTRMRLISLLFTATLAVALSWAAGQTPSSAADQQVRPDDKPASAARAPANASQPAAGDQQADSQFNLPVSLDRIKDGLEQHPTLTLKLDDVKPTFRVQILERQKIEELLATLNFKT